MGWIIVALGAICAGFGGYFAWSGLDIIQSERGWSAVIAGTVLLSGGLISVSLGLMTLKVTTLARRIQDALKAGILPHDSAAVAQKTAEAPSEQPPVAPHLAPIAAELAVGASAAAAVAAALHEEAVKPDSAPAQTSAQDGAAPHDIFETEHGAKSTPPEEAHEAEPLLPGLATSDVEPQKIELPKIDLPKIELPKIERPKIELPKIERPKIELPKLDSANTASAIETTAPIIEQPAAPLLPVQKPSPLVKPSLPPVEAYQPLIKSSVSHPANIDWPDSPLRLPPIAPPTPVSVPAPGSVAAEADPLPPPPDWLTNAAKPSIALKDSLGEFAAKPPHAAEAGQTAVSSANTEAPHLRQALPESTAQAPAADHHAPVSDPAPVSDHPAPTFAHHDTPSNDEPAAHAHNHDHAHDRAHAHDQAHEHDHAHAPTVVGRYEAAGTNYAMYSDGSVEAENAHGVFRFASMAELRTFIEEGNALNDETQPSA